jgi:hypothetical protein
MRRRDLLVAATVLSVSVCGCGGHDDRLDRIASCLRHHGARELPEPSFVRPAEESRGWRLGRFLVRGDAVSILVARSDAVAVATRRKVDAAMDALGGRRPETHRRGPIVFWWDEPPSAEQRGLFERCAR